MMSVPHVEHFSVDRPLRWGLEPVEPISGLVSRLGPIRQVLPSITRAARPGNGDMPAALIAASGVRPVHRILDRVFERT